VRGNKPSTTIRRHSRIVRVTHWINVLCFLVLLLSGLQIFNAHPALYWGQISNFEAPVFAMTARRQGGDLVGETKLFDRAWNTTGWLGASKSDGLVEARGFPSWATLPSYQDLATGRRWHFFFAWLFVINTSIYLVSTMLGRHFWRDLLPSGSDLRRIGRSVWDHVRLRFPEGDEARRYNVLQKLSYLAVAFILFPLAILTGLTMSPGMNAVVPELLTLFGGRQSARTIHFLAASALVLFVIVHLVMVVLSGPWNNLRSMITGSYVIRGGGSHEREA
jgi:thiosulfate reductase cytochrome b subunit